MRPFGSINACNEQWNANLNSVSLYQNSTVFSTGSDRTQTLIFGWFFVGEGYFVSNKVVAQVGSKVAIVKQPKIVKQLINTGKIKMQRSFGYRCIVSKLNAVAKENGIQRIFWIPFFVDISRFFGLFWNFDSLTNFCVLHENTRESVNDSVSRYEFINVLVTVKIYDFGHRRGLS